jgi:hypothetical protein
MRHLEQAILPFTPPQAKVDEFVGIGGTLPASAAQLAPRNDSSHVEQQAMELPVVHALVQCYTILAGEKRTQQEGSLAGEHGAQEGDRNGLQTSLKRRHALAFTWPFGLF